MIFKPESSTDDKKSRYPDSAQSKTQSEQLHGCMQSTLLLDRISSLAQFNIGKGEKDLAYPEAQMLKWAGIRSF